MPRETLAELIGRIVWVERPVHVDQVYERVLGLYGQQRLGKRVKGALSGALLYAIEKGWVAQRGAFLWRGKADSRRVVPRGPGDVRRRAEQICPEK